MLRAFWSSKTAMVANQEKLDIISNNISNIGTTGYKKAEVGFKDLLSESLDRFGYPTVGDSSVIGTGSKTTNVYRNERQGNLISTAIMTDLGIDGEGYFKVAAKDGTTYYTRSGKFNIDVNGNLVTDNGLYLDIKYESGFNINNIDLDGKNTLINKKGEILQKNNDSYVRVGTIPIYTAVGTEAFIPVGESLYVQNPNVTVEEASDFSIYQGHLENSNVDISEEFTDMIITQRAFQLASKGMQTADDMWGMINNLRG